MFALVKKKKKYFHTQFLIGVNNSEFEYYYYNVKCEIIIVINEKKQKYEIFILTCPGD